MYVYNHPKRGSLVMASVISMACSAVLVALLFILSSSGLTSDMTHFITIVCGFISVFCAPAIAFFFLNSHLTNIYRAFHPLLYFVLPNVILLSSWYVNIQVHSGGSGAEVSNFVELLLYQYSIAFVLAGVWFAFFYIKDCSDTKVLRLEAAKQSFKAQVKSFTLHEQCPNNMADHLKEVIVPYVEKLEDIDEVDEITEMLSKYESGWDMHEPLFNRPYSS